VTHRSNVVPETAQISEAQFTAAQLSGLARAEKAVGDKALAYVMDVTTRQLANIMGGASTNPKRLWDALSADGSVLDDIAALYGKRIVSKDAVCDVDDAGLLIARLMAWFAEASHPDSPGGRRIVHTELLPAEFMIRQLHRATGDWLAQIERARAA
jgi:hypothetical protein